MAGEWSRQEADAHKSSEDEDSICGPHSIPEEDLWPSANLDNGQCHSGSVHY